MNTDPVWESDDLPQSIAWRCVACGTFHVLDRLATMERCPQCGSQTVRAVQPSASKHGAFPADS